MSNEERKCENCIEWEFFEGYGYGCFCMQTMTPINANECEYYSKYIPKYSSTKESDTDAEEFTE